tara:strand:+ start:49 stop:582 length:534 start_codon:yes stop_codon:yes gene_type:complete
VGNFQPSRTIVAAGKTTIGKNFHTIAVEQDVLFAHSGDNTVIVEIPNVKIPAGSIIWMVAATITELSNLATMNVNLQMSATSGTAADSSISSGTELLGAGASATMSTDGASAAAIAMGTDADDLKEGYFKEISQAAASYHKPTADMYLYICNDGTGNGTTNPTAGKLAIVVQYFGVD